MKNQKKNKKVNEKKSKLKNFIFIIFSSVFPFHRYIVSSFQVNTNQINNNEFYTQ